MKYPAFKQGDDVDFCGMPAKVLSDSSENENTVEVLADDWRQRWFKVFEGTYVTKVERSDS